MAATTRSLLRRSPPNGNKDDARHRQQRPTLGATAAPVSGRVTVQRAGTGSKRPRPPATDCRQRQPATAPGCGYLAPQATPRPFPRTARHARARRGAPVPAPRPTQRPSARPRRRVPPGVAAAGVPPLPPHSAPTVDKGGRRAPAAPGGARRGAPRSAPPATPMVTRPRARAARCVATGRGRGVARAFVPGSRLKRRGRVSNISAHSRGAACVAAVLCAAAAARGRCAGTHHTPIGCVPTAASTAGHLPSGGAARSPRRGGTDALARALSRGPAVESRTECRFGELWTAGASTGPTT